MKPPKSYVMTGGRDERQLTLDPEIDAYRDEQGSVFLSVTSAIKEAGIMDFRHVPVGSVALDRGTEAHDAIEKLLRWKFEQSPEQKILDGISAIGGVDNWIRPFVEAVDKFSKDVKLRIVEVERRYAHPIWRFCGKADLLGHVNGSPKLAVIDWKTGGVMPWHGLQTGGYRILTGAEERYSLYLGKDGSYKLHAHRDYDDERVFLAALGVAQWKRAKGIKTT